MEISIEAIKELRTRTGAGVLSCREALVEADADMEAAVSLLRERGLAEAAKRPERETLEGRVECYVHLGNRIATMLELNCETDFVASTEDFRQLAHELAMQVAAANPRFVRPEEVPEAVLEEERARHRAEFEGKPPQVLERIVEGKLKKFIEEACLLEQPYIRDPDRKVRDIVADTVVKMGENIVVRRFVRYELGV